MIKTQYFYRPKQLLYNYGGKLFHMKMLKRAHVIFKKTLFYIQKSLNIWNGLYLKQ